MMMDNRWSNIALIFSSTSILFLTLYLIGIDTLPPPLSSGKSIHSTQVQLDTTQVIGNNQQQQQQQQQQLVVDIVGEAGIPPTTPLLPKFDTDGPGGIIVFFHVAKTGGTSIRGLFEELANENPSRFDYQWFNYIEDLYNDPDKTQEKLLKAIHDRRSNFDEIEDHLRNNSKSTTLLLEVHGYRNGGLHEFVPRLQYWRSICKELNLPFFAFTILRDPQSFMFSYFRYFHVNCDWCPPVMEQFNEPTFENFLKIATEKPNIQCRTLLYADDPNEPDFPQTTEKDCRYVYFLMKESLDWVGTLETLSTETLPLIHNMVGKKLHKVEPMLNQRDQLPFENDVTEERKQLVMDVLAYDNQLYQHALNDYIFSDMYPELMT